MANSLLGNGFEKRLSNDQSGHTNAGGRPQPLVAVVARTKKIPIGRREL